MLKRIRELRELWIKEKERAKIDKKKLPQKYYQSTLQRIKYAEKQIEIYNKKEQEFLAVIKKKEIEI